MGTKGEKYVNNLRTLTSRAIVCTRLPKPPSLNLQCDMVTLGTLSSGFISRSNWGVDISPAPPSSSALRPKKIIFYFVMTYFWLIWFINQRASYNQALCAVVGVGIVIGIIVVICAHLPPGRGLDIETCYLVYTCTYATPCMHIKYLLILTCSFVVFNFGTTLWFGLLHT